jgi:hypothetical protein
MLDCQLYGRKAGGHHFTNVLLHALGVLLLFLVLRQMTGALWRSAFVATLFAIHPLHVESVAWIAERKDVLSGVFFMLTLGAYVRYVRATIDRPLLGRGSRFRPWAYVQTDAGDSPVCAFVPGLLAARPVRVLLSGKIQKEASRYAEKFLARWSRDC